LMRKRIAAAEYTRPGDPLRIDAGYRPNGMSHPTNEDLSAGTPVLDQRVVAGGGGNRYHRSRVNKVFRR
jgi:hypothetical protein